MHTKRAKQGRQPPQSLPVNAPVDVEHGTVPPQSAYYGRPLDGVVPGAEASVTAGRDELRLITRDAAARTGALTALLIAGTAPRKRPDVLCTSGPAPGDDQLAAAVGLSEFAGRVLESERTTCEPIAPGQNPLRAGNGSGASVTHAVGAPVRTPGRASGALCVGFADSPADPAATIWVVESYARLASLCLHDAGALDGLLAAARLDALTGCLNHSAIHSELEREIARSARYRRNLSCCFVDLDRFKLVNDRHGHPEGSRVLVEVAAILRVGVRSGDTVGRYGGDEFIVVLPDTETGAARTLAERLRSRIRSANLITELEPIDASIGLAQWCAGTTAADLVSAADDALRAAKLAGGGSVVTAGDVAARADENITRIAG